MLLDRFDAFFTNVSIPPFALRTDLTVFLFLGVVFLETGIMFCLSPKELRVRILWVTPLINIISSCFLGPAQVVSKDDFAITAPIFLPALTIYESRYDNSGFEEILLTVFWAFFVLVVLFGLLSVCIEASLAHFSIQPSSRELWKSLGLANAVSYSFLFGWSFWVGLGLEEQQSGNPEDHLIDHIGYRLSERGVPIAQNYALLLFFLAIGISAIIVLLGTSRNRKFTNQKLYENKNLEKSLRILVFSFAASLIANVSPLFIFLAGYLLLVIGLPVSFLLCAFLLTRSIKNHFFKKPSEEKESSERKDAFRRIEEAS
ncbi:MAG: hypothetical protein ACXACI_18640 [Candidatus Hodarchaeales archaeon]